MQTLTYWSAACVLVLATSACSSASQTDRAGTDRSAAPSARAAVPAAKDYDPSRFGDSANVEHRWYPLRPGTRLDYRGSSVDEGERLRHGVTVIVTDLTKVIDGVRERRGVGAGLRERRPRRDRAGAVRPGSRRQHLAHGRVPRGVGGGHVREGPRLGPRRRGCLRRDHDPGEAARGHARLRAGLCAAADQLGRPRPRVQDRSEDLCARGLLRRRRGGRGVRAQRPRTRSRTSTTHPASAWSGSAGGARTTTRRRSWCSWPARPCRRRR